MEQLAADDKLCPPPILVAEGTDGSVSMTITPSLLHSAESLVVKEHEGPLGADAESLSGAQRVKKFSSSNREYSEVRGLLLLDLCCCCVLRLAGKLVSGILSRTATTLLQSSDITGVDWK